MRCRVIAARPVGVLVCFHRIPLSCSWQQMTFFTTRPSPSGVTSAPSKYYRQRDFDSTHLHRAKAVATVLKAVGCATEPNVAKVEHLSKVQWRLVSVVEMTLDAKCLLGAKCGARVAKCPLTLGSAYGTCISLKERR